MRVSNSNRIFISGWTIHLRVYPWKIHIDFGNLSSILFVNQYVIKRSVLHRTYILYLQLSYSVKPETPLELNEKLFYWSHLSCYNAPMYLNSCRTRCSLFNDRDDLWHHMAFPLFEPWLISPSTTVEESHSSPLSISLQIEISPTYWRSQVTCLHARLNYSALCKVTNDAFI